MSEPATGRRDWPLFEVFVRARRGLSHVHVGSLHPLFAVPSPLTSLEGASAAIEGDRRAVAALRGLAAAQGDLARRAALAGAPVLQRALAPGKMLPAALDAWGRMRGWPTAYAGLAQALQ